MRYEEALRYAVENVNAFGVPALICRPHWCASYLIVRNIHTHVTFQRWLGGGKTLNMPWTPAPHDRTATNWGVYGKC